MDKKLKQIKFNRVLIYSVIIASILYYIASFYNLNITKVWTDPFSHIAIVMVFLLLALLLALENVILELEIRLDRLEGINKNEPGN